HWSSNDAQRCCDTTCCTQRERTAPLAVAPGGRRAFPPAVGVPTATARSRTTGRRAGFNGRGPPRQCCTPPPLPPDVSSRVRPGFVDRATLRPPTRLTLIEEARHSAIPFCPDTP